MAAYSHVPAGELKLLTALRGLAAWWVVLYHIRLSMPWTGPTVQTILSKGYLGVDFFFLLSGFVIWISAQKDFSAVGGRAYGPFLWRRIARLAPLYFLMLAFAISLGLIIQMTGRTDPRLFAWSELPFHIFMIQAWGIIDPLKWNVPAWSISTEMAAYLIFPVIAVIIKQFGSSRTASLVLTTVIICCLYLFYNRNALDSLGDDIWHSGLVRCLLLFAAGACVAHIWFNTSVEDNRTSAFALALICVAATAWSIGFLNQVQAIPVLFASTLFIVAQATRRWPDVTPAWLHYAGEISYSTYLFHYLGWHVFKMLFVSEVQNVAPGYIVAYLVMVMLASIVLYQFVERPAQSWLKSKSPFGKLRIA